MAKKRFNPGVRALSPVIGTQETSYLRRGERRRRIADGKRPPAGYLQSRPHPTKSERIQYLHPTKGWR